MGSIEKKGRWNSENLVQIYQLCEKHSWNVPAAYELTLWEKGKGKMTFLRSIANRFFKFSLWNLKIRKGRKNTAYVGKGSTSNCAEVIEFSKRVRKRGNSSAKNKKQEHRQIRTEIFRNTKRAANSNSINESINDFGTTLFLWLISFLFLSFTWKWEWETENRRGLWNEGGIEKMKN